MDSREDASVDNPGSRRDISIFEAVRNGDVESVKQYIVSGGDINIQDSSRRTPLHLAAWKGNSEIIELLLAAKASTSIRAMDGFTALHFTNSTECADLLLKKDPALINLKIYKGNKTALHTAVSKGSTDISFIKCLLEHGADVNAKSKQGVSPLDLTKSKPELHSLLESYIKTNESGPKKRNGQSLGHTAEEQFETEQVAQESSKIIKKRKIELDHLNEE